MTTKFEIQLACELVKVLDGVPTASGVSDHVWSMEEIAALIP